MNETMGETQKNAGIELVNYIKSKYGITEVAGHRNYYSTDCPGTNFPIEDIKNGKSTYDKDFVKSVQHDLQRVSCLGSGEGNATGNSTDKVTRDAIKQFRYIVGLPSNENIDSDLVNALNSVTKKPTIGYGWSPNPMATKYIQWYIGIPKTGIFDEYTIGKVKEWQKKVGIWGNPDGVIREKDWNKILR